MDIESQNKELEEISRSFLGSAAVLQIVNPKDLQLLKENARYFKRETFKQLSSNIEKDGRLSSVPLCLRLAGGKLEVLSGNHRVKAAIQANIERIVVIVLTQDISRAEKIAIQLSHNSLAGEDDINILSELWAKIEDINHKLYAGLSSDTLNQIQPVKLVPFTTPQVYTKYVVFAFTDPEYENLEEIIRELSTIHPATLYLSHIKDFETFFEKIKKVKTKHNIKNASLAMVKMMEIITASLAQKEHICPSSAQ
jgi:hypothetical protein